MELLAEGSSHVVPAEPTHLDSWIATGEIPFTTLIDPPGVGQMFIAELGPRETTFVVELSSMTILLKTKTLSQVYAKLAEL